METTSEQTEAEEIRTIKPHVSRFMSLDQRYLIPWLTRPITAQEVREGKIKILFTGLGLCHQNCSVRGYEETHLEGSNRKHIGAIVLEKNISHTSPCCKVMLVSLTHKLDIYKSNSLAKLWNKAMYVNSSIPKYLR